ncbi:hypothetical protein MtrunA17_Chr4g0052631 [Medicago truncatula]|uniref:Uncharacterized protein n=1 Tax=Medicago truncatula TaxID=3880 RepID=A0A396IFA8_MEDTR|nr:hypothetical protein MtrunA17_Chr4g0052631 [Medicago truncatula]
MNTVFIHKMNTVGMIIRYFPFFIFFLSLFLFLSPSLQFSLTVLSSLSSHLPLLCQYTESCKRDEKLNGSLTEDIERISDGIRERRGCRRRWWSLLTTTVVVRTEVGRRWNNRERGHTKSKNEEEGVGGGCC